MCRLFETIRIENGQPLHLPWHEERMRRSRQELWGLDEEANLGELLKIPAECITGEVRCNVIYGKDSMKFLFKPLVKRHVGSLKLVQADYLDYHVKYYDRSALDELFLKRGECDDIIIVKNGLITDSSMANLIFYDGSRWHTPAKPLLEGTCRARLIAAGAVMPVNIRPSDLRDYIGCKLINALREPGEGEMIEIDRIG